MTRKTHVVALPKAAAFEGQVLSDDPGWLNFRGECAAGVQYVFFKSGKPIGPTKQWWKGTTVKGNAIPPGTAIASFRGGRYQNDHAAILIKELSDGLYVWDQYNTSNGPKAWGKRTLRFKSDLTDYSNNGSLFSVIET